MIWETYSTFFIIIGRVFPLGLRSALGLQLRPPVVWAICFFWVEDTGFDLVGTENRSALVLEGLDHFVCFLLCEIILPSLSLPCGIPNLCNISIEQKCGGPQW